MHGFKLFCESASDDISIICTQLMRGTDQEIYLHMLYEKMKDLGNDLKASYIEKVISSDNSRQRKEKIAALAYSGSKGFCTPLGVNGYLYYQEEITAPAVRFNAGRLPYPFVAYGTIPFKKQVVERAINMQMGVGQLTDGKINPNDLDVDGIVMRPEDVRHPEGQVEAVTQMVMDGEDIYIHFTMYGKKFNNIRWDLEEAWRLWDMEKEV